MPREGIPQAILVWRLRVSLCAGLLHQMLHMAPHETTGTTPTTTTTTTTNKTVSWVAAPNAARIATLRAEFLSVMRDRC